VLTDDHGWTSLSDPIDPNYPSASSDFYKTTNINKLMRMGMRFTEGYAASPVCSPSRYSIQFGKSAARIRRTLARGDNYADHNQVGIPQLLKSIDSKYRCAHFGKWHIDENPSRYGYDVHDGLTKNEPGGFHYDDHTLQWKGYRSEDPKKIYSLTDKTIDFIKDCLSRDQPFFVQLSHYAVHSDLVYTEESYREMLFQKPGERHRNLSFGAMLLDLDKSIGTLLEAYKHFDLGKNTYIIFTSDNGGMPVLPIQVNRGRPYKNGLNEPLVRGKWDLMEGGVRVPFSISGPSIKKDTISRIPVVGYDLLPTIVDLANKKNQSIDLPKGTDGVSIKEILFQTNKTERLKRPFDGIVFHYPHYNICGLFEPHSAIRRGDYKLVRFHVSERSLLFDLSADISENNDLSSSFASIAQNLEQSLSQYLELVDAERMEESFTWKRSGNHGEEKTLFFTRYDD
jgi:arylsulfatase A